MEVVQSIMGTIWENCSFKLDVLLVNLEGQPLCSRKMKPERDDGNREPSTIDSTYFPSWLSQGAIWPWTNYATAQRFISSTVKWKFFSYVIWTIFVERGIITREMGMALLILELIFARDMIINKQKKSPKALSRSWQENTGLQTPAWYIYPCRKLGFSSISFSASLSLSYPLASCDLCITH